MESASFLMGGNSALLREFIVREMRMHLENSEFTEAVVGCFRTDSVSRERARIIQERMSFVAS